MKDAINRRNASGRWYITFDPEISEWGNPDPLDLSFPSQEKERTQGSETSQYLEEQKTKASSFPFARYVRANGKLLSRFPK